MSASSPWVSEQIYSDAQSYYDALLVDIKRARHSVDLAVYRFHRDEVGRRFLSALSAAARRGVAIRLLLDGFGSSLYARSIAEYLHGRGVQVHIYHPLPWYVNNYRWSLTAGSWLQKWLLFVARLNRRDHRKFCIIDRQWVWCGSFNICADHLSVSPPWRDYGARLSQPVKDVAAPQTPMRDLVRSFDSVWMRREGRKWDMSLRYFRTNSSLWLRFMSNRLLALRIRHARNRVWICNAYFAPTGKIIRAIRRACARGVDVKLIVAGKSDVKVFPMLSATYYADLLQAGVSIYRYRRGMLHAKVMLIDEDCLVGSSNMNHRSLYHDLELDVILKQPQSVQQMEGLLLRDMDGSERLSSRSLSRWQSTLSFGWLLRVIRYWM